jgi:hypothetical protein
MDRRGSAVNDFAASSRLASEPAQLLCEKLLSEQLLSEQFLKKHSTETQAKKRNQSLINTSAPANTELHVLPSAHWPPQQPQH